ncbi:MAG: ribosome silencing factor [Helicobacteraceae bacterium]|nr:ribosome silencing factor [Helicobacteraceae bacterium]
MDEKIYEFMGDLAKKSDFKSRLDRVRFVLDYNKAERVEVFDLRESEYIFGGAVIATALADRHLEALSDALKQALKPLGEEFLHTDASGEWIVIDMGDILAHIMTENAREKYNLEAFLDEFKKKRALR